MLNLAGMRPAQRDVERGFLLPCADYVGGRLHGLLSAAGLHELHRDEYGRGIDAEAAARIPHYRLYVNGSMLHYIHTLGTSCE